MMIQDIAPHRFDNHYDPAARPCGGDAALHFRGRELLCRTENGNLTFPAVGELPEGEYTYLFRLDGRGFFLRRDAEVLGAEGCAYQDISLFRTARPSEAALAAVTAFHLASWYAEARFCGKCGAKTVHDGAERMMRCPACGHMIFPKIMPSVIVAVTEGDKLLLTRYANRPGASRFALVAGFTEIGETAEQTVAREVMEEVGLRVRNVRYYKSQPWGISAGGLLLGFWCEVDGADEIHLDRMELAEGAWVTRDELRAVYQDRGVSLTNEMIVEFIKGNNP